MSTQKKGAAPSVNGNGKTKQKPETKSKHSNKQADKVATGEIKPAEKYTEATVLPILTAMWKDLIKDDDTEQDGENPVRANSIKLFKEICLIHGISSKTFIYWQNKFCEQKQKNEEGQLEDNPMFSEAIST